MMCNKRALAAVLWYPCNRVGLCYCNSAGTSSSPTTATSGAATNPFSACSRVENIPGDKRRRLPDYACRRCRNGAHRHYPCLPVPAASQALLCQCAT